MILTRVSLKAETALFAENGSAACPRKDRRGITILPGNPRRRWQTLAVAARTRQDALESILTRVKVWLAPSGTPT